MKPEDSMGEESINTGQPEPRWFIDLDWLQQNNRSLFVLVQDCLCPKCRKRLGAGGEVPAADLLSAISDCCSKTPGFITHRLPILGSIFRLFLANGNQPLELEELKRQLSEWWGGDVYRISTEALSRLLSSDQYYGLGQVPESEESES